MSTQKYLFVALSLTAPLANALAIRANPVAPRDNQVLHRVVDLAHFGLEASSSAEPAPLNTNIPMFPVIPDEPADANIETVSAAVDETRDFAIPSSKLQGPEGFLSRLAKLVNLSSKPEKEGNPAAVARASPTMEENHTDTAHKFPVLKIAANDPAGRTEASLRRRSRRASYSTNPYTNQPCNETTTPIYKRAPIEKLPCNETVPLYKRSYDVAAPIVKPPCNETARLYEPPYVAPVPVVKPPCNETVPLYKRSYDVAAPVVKPPCNETAPLYEPPSDVPAPVVTLPLNYTTVPMAKRSVSERDHIVKVPCNETAPLYTPPVYTPPMNTTGYYYKK